MQENPSLKMVEVTKEIGSRWKEMTSSDKAKYEQMAKDDKERYDREMKVYKAKGGADAGSGDDGSDNDD